MSHETKPNRLIEEKSPYLQQHAYNPIDWRPWSEEAFAEARERQVPVFLSIGYSTCHWCHVMERESFEDDEVAALLNDSYVAIKVDREERPDIDQVYMTVCQAITGRGGWPMTLILTPEATPFFAATYLPKHPRGGAPGLLMLLDNVTRVWAEDRAKLTDSGDKVVMALKELTDSGKESSAADAPFQLGRAPAMKAEAHFIQLFDEEFGGFGSAPKFPSPHQLEFLLERYRQGNESKLLSCVTRTLEAMRAGGLWDHVGYGFHRYATDREWLTPHFEKMLYDQAGLAMLYARTAAITGKRDFALTARQTLEYVQRELSDDQGGFYCGEDADSEGEEGLFYIWSRSEAHTLLAGEHTQEQSQDFLGTYDITEEGNYVEEATGEPTGKAIPNLTGALNRGALGRTNPSSDTGWAGDCAQRFEGQLATLFQKRQTRVRPFKDDKTLTAWSGFAASAFATVGALTGDESLVERATRAVEFIDSMLTVDGKLMRRHRQGEAAVEAFAEDYAFLARARLDLYAATWEARHLDDAKTTATTLWEQFSDEDGGLWDAPEESGLILRPRDATDGAIPSATSVAVECFARLGLLTGEVVWDERAASAISVHAKQVSSHPQAFTHLLLAADYLKSETRRVEVTADVASPEAAKLREFLLTRTPFGPRTVFNNWAGLKTPTVQICDRSACLFRATGIDELEEFLKR